METLTLTVAAVGSLLVILLPPVYALGVYIAVLVSYPTYVMVTIEGIHISAARIVIVVLSLKGLLDADIKKNFKWCELDTWVSISMTVYVGMMFINSPFGATFQNRAGYLMDSWLAYFVTRLYITNRKTMLKVIKVIGLILVPIAALGIIESWTGWQPYLRLREYCPWRPEAIPVESRLGLYRAIGPFGHHIMFGITFAMFLPILYWLRHQQGYWRTGSYVIAGIFAIGTISSMSSGPIIMFGLTFCFLIFERFKRCIKPIIILLVISCVLVQVTSTRNFYYVIADYVDPVSGGGWHRARLIDVAIEHFDEWWLFGYGDQDPGWGRYLGDNKTDITNEFILAGVQYGILGIIALCSVLVVIFSNLARLYNSAIDAQTKSLVWAFGSSMAATVCVFTTVSFFGQIISLLYCVFGMIGSAGSIYSRKTSRKSELGGNPKLLPYWSG
jgi:hypothetical protein